jgi:hypothetical protein
VLSCEGRGAGLMQGSKKPPATTPVRRDDRAEPDDEGSSPRIDFVNVDGPVSSSSTGSGVVVGTTSSTAARSEGTRGEGAAAGLTSLKSQLAKLQEQASAVERSLDDQRRDRSDALDRLERATERCISLEAKVTGFEAEAISLRKMHEASLADLESLKEENEGLHSTLEESMRAAATFEGELSELRKRQFKEALKATEQETELTALRAKLERATNDGTEADATASKAKFELARAREALTKADKEIAVGREEAMQAREATAKAENTISAARGEASKAREELSKLRQDLASAKEDNTKDRATARDRIDLLERALDDARAATARTEAQLDASRASEGAMGQQLEAAVARATDADSRAAAAAASQTTLEQNVRRLREDIAGAFARMGHGAAPPPLPPGARPEPRVAPSDREEAPQSIPPELLDSVPPSLRDDVPPVAPIPYSPPLALSLELDNDWSAPDSVRPKSALPTSASPASRSVPPPPSTISNEGAPAGPDSIPPPTYASVPPQIHDSVIPSPLPRVTPPPPRRESTAPATRRGGASAAPSGIPSTEVTREELLAQLVHPAHGAAAAQELKLHPEWLRSVPPMTLIAALQSVDYDSDRPVFDLARQWEREPLCHALIASLRAEPEARLREHGAWLLKHLAAPSSWKAIADLARSDDEGIQLRRWLLEALDRLAAGRAIGWRELGDVITTVAKHPDASLRDGVVGILVSLDRSDEKRRLLVEILRSDDDEVVLASAVNALASALPMELDPGLVERLLGHPSPRVQRSVRDLIERAKQTKS